MQLCLSGSLSCHVPLERQVRTAAQARFASVEVWVSELDAYLAEHPLIWLDLWLSDQKVHLMAVRGLEPISLDSREARLVLQAHLLELCARIDALGGAILCLQAGSLPNGAKRGEWVVAQLASELRMLSELAAPFDVRLAFECCVAKCEPICSLTQGQEIVRRVARSNVGLVMDIDASSCGSNVSGDLGALDVAHLAFVRIGGAGKIVEEMLCTEERVSADMDSTQLQHICQHLLGLEFRGPYSVELPAAAYEIPELASAVQCAVVEMLEGCG